MPLSENINVGEMGFFSDVLDKLSDEAKKITKGDLIQLGLNIVPDRIKKATYGEIEIIKNACKKVLIEGQPPEGGPTGGGGRILGVPDEAGLSISCCCCPCCCATAVIKPSREVI
jgi:hypothetical protein